MSRTAGLALRERVTGMVERNEEAPWLWLWFGGRSSLVSSLSCRLFSSLPPSILSLSPSLLLFSSLLPPLPSFPFIPSFILVASWLPLFCSSRLRVERWPDSRLSLPPAFAVQKACLLPHPDYYLSIPARYHYRYYRFYHLSIYHIFDSTAIVIRARILPPHTRPLRYEVPEPNYIPGESLLNRRLSVK